MKTKNLITIPNTEQSWLALVLMIDFLHRKKREYDELKREIDQLSEELHG